MNGSRLPSSYNKRGLMTVSRLTGTVFHSIPYLSTSKEIEQFVSTPSMKLKEALPPKWHV